MERLYVTGADVLWHEDGRDYLVPRATLVVEGDRIVGLLQELPGEAGGQVLNAEGTLAIPGFINVHTHALLGSFYRGITDDFNREAYGGSALYALLFPLMEISDQHLTPEQSSDLIALGMVEMLKSGCTTICESTTGPLEPYVAINAALGSRMVLSPNFKSLAAMPKAGETGKVEYSGAQGDDLAPLRANISFHRQYNDTQSGRFQVRLGPHAPDTCSAALLQATAEAAEELETTVSIHLAQSRVEDEAIRRQHGCSPVEFLHRIGLLTHRLTAGHCVFTDEHDLDLMAASGMTVAHCPNVFFRGGLHAPSWKYIERGVNVGVGTDSYALDMIQELRAAALLGKLATQRAHLLNAPLALQMGTAHGAKSLGRTDLGRLQVGAKADIVLVELTGAHMAPVYDPIRNLMYNASAADVRDVLVDGQLRVQNRKVLGLNEEALIRRASDAARQTWEVAERAGILRSPYAVPPSLA